MQTHILAVRVTNMVNEYGQKKARRCRLIKSSKVHFLITRNGAM